MHLSKSSSVCFSGKRQDFAASRKIAIVMLLGFKLQQILHSKPLGWFLKFAGTCHSFLLSYGSHSTSYAPQEEKKCNKSAVVTAAQHSSPLLILTLRLDSGGLHEDTVNQGDLPLLSRRWPCEQDETTPKFSLWVGVLRGGTPRQKTLELFLLRVLPLSRQWSLSGFSETILGPALCETWFFSLPCNLVSYYSLYFQKFFLNFK